MRKHQKLTFHMCGIIVALSEGPLENSNFIPSALLSLATRGFVGIKHMAWLTERGLREVGYAKEVLQAHELGIAE